MKKDILLPALALAGGVGGFALRRWQLLSAYQPDTGLFNHGAPATFALLALTGLLSALFLLLIQGGRTRPEDFLPAFGCPESGQATVLTAAGLLFFAAGAVGLRDSLTVLQLARQSVSGQLTYPLSLLAASLLALPSGAAVLLLGRAAYRGELTGTACRLAPFPAMTGLVWLFSTHLAHGTEPVLMVYGFGLAAAGLLMLAHYCLAGFLFGHLRPRLVLFCSLTGTLLGLLSLADGLPLSTVLLTMAFSLSALGWSRALLRNMSAPVQSGRMPSGAEEIREGPQPGDSSPAQ